MLLRGAVSGFVCVTAAQRLESWQPKIEFIREGPNATVESQCAWEMIFTTPRR
jgi:hypothetical protein